MFLRSNLLLEDLSNVPVVDSLWELYLHELGSQASVVYVLRFDESHVQRALLSKELTTPNFSAQAKCLIDI